MSMFNHDYLIWKKFSVILLDQFHGLYELPMVVWEKHMRLVCLNILNNYLFLQKKVLPIIWLQSSTQWVLFKGVQKTFGDIAKLTFNTMMAEVTSVKRIGVVFYVYRVNSIKNIEQVENKSATTALKLYQISPTQKIQQWREFLKGPKNKKEFIMFLTSEWESGITVQVFNIKKFFWHGMRNVGK